MFQFYFHLFLYQYLFKEWYNDHISDTSKMFDNDKNTLKVVTIQSHEKSIQISSVREFY